MRTPLCVAVVLIAVIAAVSPGYAARLNIPDDNNVAWTAYSSRQIEQPWATQRPETQLTELRIGDIIATRLGIAKGSAELFSYRLENAPSSATILRGQIDGGGIRLKLNW
jgi:hypothetical protein